MLRAHALYSLIDRLFKSVQTTLTHPLSFRRSGKPREKPASWDLPSNARGGAVAGSVATLSQRIATLAKLLVVFALAVLSVPMSVMSQGVQYTANKMENTRRASVRVDPLTLAMNLTIPITEYPQRGGGSLPITYNYSSRVWRIESQGPIDSSCAPFHPELTRQLIAIYDESGGWSSSPAPPRITALGSGQPYFSWGEPWDESPQESCNEICPQYFVTRLQVHMPDGSIHELRYTDMPLQTSAPNQVYYAVDGSGLKYDLASDTLFLPDGSRYILGSPQGTPTTFIDRNGNTSTYTPTGSGGHWTDSLGRTFSSTIPGVGGTTQTIIYRVLPVSQVMSSSQSGNGFPVCGTSYGYSEPVVLAEIQLPNGTKYQFKYNDYFEVDKIVYPTGGYERFRYAEVQSASFYGSPYSQTNRGVVERWVSPSGSGLDEEHWQYATPSPTLRLMTAPDNTRTETVVFADPFYGGDTSFGHSDVRVGLPIEERVYSATNQMLRRRLLAWDVTNGGYRASRHSRPAREVEIILDTGTSSALARTTIHNYDLTYQFSVGPIKVSVNEYDWVWLDQGTAQTAAIGSIPLGNLLRTEETTNLILDPNISQSVRDAYRARNLVSLPTSTRIKDASGNIVAQGSISYDEYSLTPIGSVASWIDPETPYRGNATTAGRWLDTTGAYVQTHAYYDQFGNVRTVIDAKGNQSQVDYSSTYQYAYPTTTTTAVPDPSGQYGSTSPFSATTTYDFNTGLVLSTMDPNGRTTSMAYSDSLNRLTQVTQPNGAHVNYSYSDTPNNLYVRVLSDEDASRAIETRKYFDNLGRAVRGFLYDGSPSTPWLVTDTYYDNMGRVTKVSNPYRVSSPSGSVPASCSSCTTSAYDALGRVISVTTPDSAQVTTSYGALTSGSILGTTVLATDQSGKKRRSLTDSLGRLVRVDEPDASGNLGDISNPVQKTSYAYDVLGNLRTVTQESQQRFFMYDSLSRLIRARNPEQAANPNLNLTDSVSGNSQWSMGYAYDNNGNLTTRVDPRNVIATYVYDALNRNQTITYTNDPAGTPTVSLFYDGWRGAVNNSIANSKGRLWQSETAGATGSRLTINAYDVMGQPLQQGQQFNTTSGWSGAFTVGRSYDLGGHVSSQSYPSGRSVTYNYDIAGRLGDKDAQNLAFFGNLGDDTSRTYASGIKYSPFGGMEIEQFGTDTALYHKRQYNVRGQLWDVRVSTGADVNGTWNRGCLQFFYDQAGSYGGSGADNNGNVLATKHYRPMDEQSTNWAISTDYYNYDSLNRITQVTEYYVATGQIEEQKFVQAYTYDRYGNRTINQSGTWGTGINNKQFTANTANNQLEVPGGQSGTMSYDFAGNLTTDTYSALGVTRVYDAENRMTSETQAGSYLAGSYTYDGDGRRVRRKVNSSETWQVYGMDGELLAEYANASASSPPKEYGYRNGQLLVIAEPAAQIKWLVADQLGTPRIIIDKTGALANVKRHDYLPFGEELFANQFGRTEQQGYVINGADTVRRKFTLKERDNETGLDYFGARYYSSMQGRFTSVDPVYESAELFTPQSWNRYAYCLNNPLLYTDPTGTVWVKDKDNNRIWIPHNQWDAASQGTGSDGNPLYTLLTTDEMEYDSVAGRVRLDPFGPNPDNPQGWSIIGPNQGSGVGAAVVAGAAIAMGDSPAPGPADLIGLIIIGGAIVTHATNQPLLTPLIFNQDKGTKGSPPATPGPGTSSTQPVPVPTNPATPPAPGWVWKGSGAPGSSKGAWTNPATGESLHPDLAHPGPIGPHWDYKDSNKKNWRIMPDGSKVPKQ